MVGALTAGPTFPSFSPVTQKTGSFVLNEGWNSYNKTGGGGSKKYYTLFIVKITGVPKSEVSSTEGKASQTSLHHRISICIGIA